MKNVQLQPNEEKSMGGFVVYIKKNSNYWPLTRVKDGELVFTTHFRMQDAAEEAAKEFNLAHGTIVICRRTGTGNGLGVFRINNEVKAERLLLHEAF